MSGSFDISKARERFPALKQDQVFLDNAGGSQALGDVVDSYVGRFTFRLQFADEIG
jgi:selenocysteine lyase/cysteine desulfurase